MTSLILRLMNIPAYVFTEEFLVDNNYDSLVNNMCKVAN